MVKCPICDKIMGKFNKVRICKSCKKVYFLTIEEDLEDRKW